MLTRRRSQVGWLVLLLVIIGCWLRVWTIQKNSLWFDEAFSRDVVVHSNLSNLLHYQQIGDTQPPVHFVLLYLWSRIAGDSEIGLRILSAFASMLALPAFYHLGRLLFNRQTGVIALLLGALSPVQIVYAQEARNYYAISIALAAWALIGLVLLLRGNRYGWLLYVVAATIGLYTHYFVGVALVAVHPWLVTNDTARKQWRRWLLADVMIAVLFLPQAFEFLWQSQTVLGGFWITKPNPAAPITTLTFLVFGMSLPADVAALGIVVLSCTLTIMLFDMLFRASRRIRNYWVLCMGSVILALLLIMVISQVRSSIYLDKAFVPLTPLLIVALAAGAVYARRPSPARWLVGALVILMVVGVVIHASLPDPAKPPFRDIAADLVRQNDALSVPILYLHDSVPLPIDYYAPQLTPLARVVDLGDHSWMWPQSAMFPQTWQIFGYQPSQRLSRQQVAQWLANYHGKLRVIATSYMEPTEINTLRALLTQNCLQDRRDYPNVNVYTFNGCGSSTF